ncbi:hypothetical protein ACWEO2_23005 [Nocardia sp. NPDC004278]
MFDIAPMRSETWETAAMVSRGGEPIWRATGSPISRRKTLLIIGGDDNVVFEFDQLAQALMRCETAFAVVSGAPPVSGDLRVLGASSGRDAKALHSIVKGPYPCRVWIAQDQLHRDTAIAADRPSCRLGAPGKRK